MEAYKENPLENMNILPSQFYSVRGPHSPERRLMLAVLEDAVGCYIKHKDGTTRRSRRLKRETEGWFQSTDATFLYSFENICLELDLDPSVVRGRLLKKDSTCKVPKIRLIASVRVIS